MSPASPSSGPAGQQVQAGRGRGEERERVSGTLPHSHGRRALTPTPSAERGQGWWGRVGGWGWGVGRVRDGDVGNGGGGARRAGSNSHAASSSSIASASASRGSAQRSSRHGGLAHTDCSGSGRRRPTALGTPLRRRPGSALLARHSGTRSLTTLLLAHTHCTADEPPRARATAAVAFSVLLWRLRTVADRARC